MKEELSLSYAKQSFKRNKWKYSTGDNLEAVIYYYQLRKDELDSLRKYAIKLLPNEELKINMTIDRCMKEYM